MIALWSIESKAFEKSVEIVMAASFDGRLEINDVIFSSAWEVVVLLRKPNCFSEITVEFSRRCFRMRSRILAIGLPTEIGRKFEGEGGFGSGLGLGRKKVRVFFRYGGMNPVCRIELKIYVRKEI